MINPLQTTIGFGIPSPLAEHSAQQGALHDLRTHEGESLESYHVDPMAKSSGQSSTQGHAEHALADHVDKVTLESDRKRRERFTELLEPPEPTPVQLAAKRQSEQMTKVRNAAMKFLLSAVTVQVGHENGKKEKGSSDTTLVDRVA